MLTNSRLGVYILLDYFGDDESDIVTDPASGPLELSGLDYADGRLFAVSETYNTLFIIDPEHGLVRTLGIENGGQISAIAVRDRTAYLPLDHNYVDERPALLTVTLD